MKRILLLTLVFATACKDGGTEPTPDPVQVVTTSLPEGTVGASYNVALSASGGTGSYGWSVSAGSLPAGLTLSAAGSISGNPSSPGQASFTVRATSGTQSGTRDLSISIQAPEVVITTATLAGGTAGTAYSQTLAASGGTGTFTWTVSGGALPAGLTLSSAGVISGTPTAGGTSSFTVQASSGGRTATRSLTITIGFPAVTVTTTTLPDGTVGTVYSQTLAASGGDGTYLWSLVSGSLPPGLSLQETGAISGTPTTAGASTFTVRASSGGTSGTKALTITVRQPAVTITTTSLPAGEVAVAYSQTLSATGGSGTITWSLTTGSLPAGLTLSGAGTIAGTPTAFGTFTFSVRATSGSQSAVASLTIIVQPPPVTITTSTLKAAIQGVAYADTVRATGGTGSYTWALAAGTLPAGLTFSGGGVISGTPTALGSSTFTVRATSGSRTATKDLTVTVGPATLVITTTSLPTGGQGEPYSQTLAASGGTGVYSWSLTAGTLPPGLTLSSAGLISGTPTAVGTFPFTVQVTSGVQTDTQGLSIIVVAAIPPVVITTSALPGGNVNEVYSATLGASGGTGSFTWSVVSGSLPAGLTLSGSGSITGTATTEGSATFTVQAASGGKVATRQLSITIGAALPDVTISTSTLPDASTGVAYSQQLSASGGNGTFSWHVSSGTLPAGISLSSGGQLSGTPTDTIDRTFTVQATSGSKSAQQTLTLRVVAGPVVITTTSVPNALLNAAYTPRTLAAVGGAGTGTYAWTVSAGALPAGMSLSGAGVLSGTPTASGTFNFTVQATSAGQSDTQALSLLVNVPAVNITTSSPLPPATQSSSYSQTLSATGGTGSYTWSLESGTLPTGLSLSAAGVISGTPTGTGTSTFTVRATSGSVFATKQFSLQVLPVGGYAIYLDVGNPPSASVPNGQNIALPISVDMSEHGTQNIASLTVTVSWDPAKFDFISLTQGSWPGGTIFLNPAGGSSGSVGITGFSAVGVTSSFTLGTVTLRAKATGTTTVSASVSAAGNEGGGNITVTPRDLTVTIN